LFAKGERSAVYYGEKTETCLGNEIGTRVYSGTPVCCNRGKSYQWQVRKPVVLLEVANEKVEYSPALIFRKCPKSLRKPRKSLSNPSAKKPITVTKIHDISNNVL
jgi:hypothetical protein